MPLEPVGWSGFAPARQSLLISREEAVGKRLNLGRPERPDWWEVVGVVGDLRSESLSSDASPELYMPVTQTPPVIWPRSAILHNAAASTVEGMRELTVSAADRIATSGAACRS